MTSRSMMTACCVILIGAGFYFAPDGVADRIRGSLNDLMRPGLEAVRLVIASSGTCVSGYLATSRPAYESEVAQLTEDLAIEQERIHALEIRLAQLHEQQLPERAVPSAISKSQRLILPSLIDVAVLGDLIADDWCSGKLLDQGTKNGLRENELVLSSRKLKKTLIDVGEDGKISTEDAMLLGRCVIGKIEDVGRWTSTFLLVTHPKYSGRAQLIRETAEGFVFDNAQGILRGQGGELCKLEGISAEHLVREHDSVITAERDGVLPTPLYYGEVVEATLGPDDREWTVFVKPVPLPSHLTTVQVLRTAVNEKRLAVK